MMPLLPNVVVKMCTVIILCQENWDINSKMESHTLCFRDFIETVQKMEWIITHSSFLEDVKKPAFATQTVYL